jgi:NADH-quinone oxidoreductase subunit G
MARKKTTTPAEPDPEAIATGDAGELRSASANIAETANAVKASTADQAANKTVGEDASKSGHPNAVPPAEKAGAVIAAEPPKPLQPLQPPVSSTQAEGGARTAGDAKPTAAAPQATAAPPSAPAGERDRTPQEKADAAKVIADAEAAKAAGVEMLKVIVDGVTVEVPKGTLAIEAAFRGGADVPYFCYHPRLTSVGACRMCLASIELEMFGQRRASVMTCCTVPCAEGMVIKTGTPEVKKAQNGMLEFLLANHPLDCPICDRGGECPLQNMTIAFGPPTSRFIEEKRHFPKAQPLSDYVVLDRERCIQCMRCTRFCEEISGDGQLTILNRGAGAEIGTFYGHDFSSNFSGNTIEICPVGALTSRTYRFAGRPWEIKSTDSVCSRCGNGCNVAVQTRLSDLVRINGRTNEDINEEWTCDRGKFGQYHVNSPERLVTPLVRDRKGGPLREATWDEALRLVERRLREVKDAHGADAIAGIGSTRCTVEDNYLLGKMLRAQIGTNHIDHQMRPYPFEPMQTSIAAIQEFKVIVSVGMRLDYDQPIVYLRVFKAFRKRGAEWLKADAVDAAGVAEALERGGENAVLLLSHDLGATKIAAAKALCARTGAKLNVLMPDCNSWGAPRAGVSPYYLPGMRPLAMARAHVENAWNVSLPQTPGRTTGEIFAGAASGAIRALYIMGSDPAVRFHDTALARRALAEAEFVVVHELFATETTGYADVVLPAASFAEKDGTFVNIEGREQKIKQAIPPRGSARPDWRILADLMARLGKPVPYFSARDIYREYSRAIAPEPLPAIAAAAAGADTPATVGVS